MKPLTLKRAVKNVMNVFPGTTFFVPGPHNVAGLEEKLKAPAKKKRKSKT